MMKKSEESWCNLAVYRATVVEDYEIEKPKIAGVPFVFDDWSLAFRLGFKGKSLWYMVNTRKVLYHEFKIPKATGGKRVIHEPKPMLKLLLRQLRSRILLPLVGKLGPHVTAYQLGHSTKDAAIRHLADCHVCVLQDKPHTCDWSIEGSSSAGKYVVTKQNKSDCLACKSVPQHECIRRGVSIHMDLKNFFTSTKMSWIRNYFKEVVGYNHYVSGLLATLLTVPFEQPVQCVGVPQGSPASGDICNLVADWMIDQTLLAYAKDNGWTYSRYADDLYFSHTQNLPGKDIGAFIQQVTSAITKSGYRVNTKKTRVQRPQFRKAVLGIVINQKVNMPHDQFRKMRSLIHNCVTTGFEAQAKRAKKENGAQLKSYIEGRLAYISMIVPERALRLRKVYDFAVTKDEQCATTPVSD